MYFKQTSTDFYKEGQARLIEDFSTTRVRDVLRIISQNDRVTILFDGSNFYKTLQDLNLNCDYESMFHYFRKHFNVSSIYYFVATSGMKQHARLSRLLSWMMNNGIRVITKTSKKHENEDGTIIYKGNMDVDLTVTCMDECQDDDVYILFTGDGDFLPLIDRLRLKGKRVIVISHKGDHDTKMSNDLKGHVDGYIDIPDLFTAIKHDTYTRLIQESDACADQLRYDPSKER